MCRTTSQQNKMRRLSLSKQTTTTKKRQRLPTPKHMNEHVARSKDVSDKFCVGESSSQPTVLELMSMIGETKESLSNETLENYMDRDLLKISQQWSQTVMKSDGKSDVRSRLFDESDMPSRGMITSLNEECARLEVNAVALLASMEHEMNKSFATEDECLIDEDDDILEEMRCIEESIGSLEEELNMSEILDYFKNVNEGEMREKEADEYNNKCLVSENMSERPICVALCA